MTREQAPAEIQAYRQQKRGKNILVGWLIVIVSFGLAISVFWARGYLG